MKKMFTDIFRMFINNECTEEIFIFELKKLESIIKSKQSNPYKDIWFRFFDDDCLATTINNIESDLKSTTNYSFIMKCIQIGVENDSIVVNFS